jgi:hypothetical protein
MTEPDDDLVAALGALPRELDPPPHVAAALLASRRDDPRRWSRTAWRVAVAASLLAATFAAGRWSAPGAPGAPDAGREFAFLLYGGAPGGTDGHAKAYGAWAMDLRRRGVPVSGERLADAAWVAGEPRPADAPIRGFFIVRAPDAAAAVEMARRHPHARVGTIEVRPVDTP